MSATDFTLAGYRALLQVFTERGYAASGYEGADPAACHLILRHDLDMSIEAALPVAEIEAGLSMRAHYFVLLRTEMYNPWSARARDRLARLAELGHEIGLHFDASLYPQGIAALDRAAAEECGVLETLLGRPVETISLHRPARGLLGLAQSVAGRRHTYQPRFFSEMGYCSDSRGAWHNGRPLDHAAVAEGRALQLLTHPIWWNRDVALDPVATLDGFRGERDEVLADALALNCEPYRTARRSSHSHPKEKSDG